MFEKHVYLKSSFEVLGILADAARLVVEDVVEFAGKKIEEAQNGVWGEE